MYVMFFFYTIYSVLTRALDPKVFNTMLKPLKYTELGKTRKNDKKKRKMNKWPY